MTLRLPAFAILLAAAAPSSAGVFDIFGPSPRNQIPAINSKICGKLLDFTHNHDGDRRIWSNALCAKRDLYVYLPPGYDGTTPFPAMLWLHGFGQDEKNFLDLVPLFDAAMRLGLMPPMVVAGPDGSISGRAGLLATGSFYLNSVSGRYEDYIVQDVWQFVRSSFAVRAEREAHVAAGGSMGGFGAYHTGFKHRHEFGVLAGLLPPLDFRYADCNDNYLANYDPSCHTFRDKLKPNRVVGKFYGGVLKVREKRLTDPMIGKRHPQGLSVMAPDNPVEMLDSLAIRPGEFRMFVGYSKLDEFNLDAQAEHFLYAAKLRGIPVDAVYLPDGHHSVTDAKRMLPQLGKFLIAAVGPYVPGNYAPVCPCGLPTEILTDRPGLLPFRRMGASGPSLPVPWESPLLDRFDVPAVTPSRP